MNKKLKLIPVIDAGDLSNEVEEEFAIAEVSTHYQSDIVYLSWNQNNNRLPEFKKWLIETYGEEVKQYDQFALMAT